MKLKFEFLKKIIGKAIIKIERLYYRKKDFIEKDKGAIQFSFNDGTVVYLDVDADSETLLIKKEKWEDPFIEPLSVENKDYVDNFGKWEIFDVSDCHEYRDLINRSVINVSSINDKSGINVGALFDVEGLLVNILTGADFLWVMFGDRKEELLIRELEIR